jgi:hypothetical protein
MFVTNSLYQLLYLFEHRQSIGHTLEPIETKTEFGWLDKTTNESLSMNLTDLQATLNHDIDNDVAQEDYAMCLNALCNGSEALWRSYTALLKTPETRARFFNYLD